MKPRPRFLALVIRELPVEASKVLIERLYRVWIEDIAFTTGSRTFHLLSRAASENSVQPPFAFRSSPFQVVIGDLVGQIELLILVRVSHQTLQLALRQIGFELFTSGDIITFEDHFARSDVGRDVWSAKRPASAGGKVKSQTKAFAFRRSVG